ncbi:MAG: apolipoprotein N-acyltransferase [Myxococcota bacterium]|nr:apolipoprotein N-acyltransferase [Myxococcota bacterium]
MTAGRWTVGVLAAAATGILTFLAFPEADLSGLAWIALAPLGFVLERGGWSAGQRFVLGWSAGWIANLGGFYWLVHLLEVFGHLPRPVAVGGYAVLALYQGLVFGLWTLGRGLLADRWPRLPRPVIDGLTFTAAELLVPFLFPWFLGNSQHASLAVAQLAELTGVAGLSFLLAATGSALGTLLAARGRASRLRALAAGGVVALVAVGVVGWGTWRLADVEQELAGVPTRRIALVEADIGIRDKGQPGRAATNLSIHQRLSRWAEAQGAELIVWPESAYDVRWIAAASRRLPPSTRPLPPDPVWDPLLAGRRGDHLRLPPLPRPQQDENTSTGALATSDRVAPQRGFATPLLFGAVTWEPDPAPPAPGPRWQRLRYNSLLLLDAHGQLVGESYRKNELLLFGERLPLGRAFPWLYELLPAVASFTPGTRATPLDWQGIRLGPQICYEAILADFPARYPPPFPDVLVVITNDAWFGKRGEPWLHLALTVFRTIEHRVALVRATNTGVSAFIEPSGRVAKHTDVEHAEVLLHDVPVRKLGPTLYERGGRYFGPLSVGVFLLLAARAMVRKGGRRVRVGSPARPRPATSEAVAATGDAVDATRADAPGPTTTAKELPRSPLRG